MLISFSCENILSFKEEQSLSLVATNKKKDNILESNLFVMDEKENLLKTALIFGANGSGKTNILAALSNMYKIVIHSLETLKNKKIGYLPPFLLDNESKDKPSEYQIEFYAKNKKKYRYGFCIKNKVIVEEWLYYTPTSREVLLFNRENNNINVAKNFKESSDFVKDGLVQKTKENIPFLSVLASFNGEHSSAIIECFLSFNFLGLDNENEDLRKTLQLWKDDEDFRNWALPVLKSLGIQDIRFEHQSIETIEEMKRMVIKEKENLNHLNINTENSKIKEKALNLFDGLFDLISSAPTDIMDEIGKEINLSTIKLVRVIDDEEFFLPFSLESSGTQKLFHLLGAMYTSCSERGILVIDEFDVKFHTLLSKYIFKLFNDSSRKGQLICTLHDTNLMDTDYFRRDQIWLMNKNERGESHLYSLVEFKELASNILNKNYSSEYLNGFYDAIPLFENLNIMEDAE